MFGLLRHRERLGQRDRANEALCEARDVQRLILVELKILCLTYDSSGGEGSSDLGDESARRYSVTESWKRRRRQRQAQVNDARGDTE